MYDDDNDALSGDAEIYTSAQPLTTEAILSLLLAILSFQEAYLSSFQPTVKHRRKQNRMNTEARRDFWRPYKHTGTIDADAQ
jgi:hypothetical protein